MNKKHPSVPWYGASTSEESVQAQAMLDALSTDPSVHISSLEEGISSIPSTQPELMKTSKRGEQIQSLIKEIPSNVKFPQAKQTKPKKHYGGASTSTGSVASTSKMHVQQISRLARSSTVPLPTPPPLSQPEEELPETLHYETAKPVGDDPDITKPSDDTPSPLPPPMRQWLKHPFWPPVIFANGTLL